MTTGFVLYAPRSEIALVCVSPTIDTFEYWLVRHDSEEVRREHAPQMWNAHHDSLGSLQWLEDQYPFPGVRARLNLLVRYAQTVDALLMWSDSGLSEEVRGEMLGVANAHAQDAEVVTLVHALFTKFPPPSLAMLSDAHIDAVAPALRGILQDIRRK